MTVFTVCSDMSADNYLLIHKGKDGKFRGYNRSASCEYWIEPGEDEVTRFEVDTTEEAIAMAQKEHSEYGYYFCNLNE